MIFHRLQPVAKAPPGEDALLPLLRDVEDEEGIGQRVGVAPAHRRRRPRLAHDLGGDPLGDLRETAPVHHEGQNGVALDVDKARADHEAAGVHHLGALFGRDGTGRRNRGNPVPANGDVGVDPRVAGTVDDAGVANECVVGWHRSFLLGGVLIQG
jgi:hypothetical protein